MGKIQKLPESLIRLIAAGEVIERPASVVKELVENSLDAGATKISVDIWGAGRTRIRVSDDGSGMSRDDAEQALERHATSKLQAFDDLQSLSTFGFRGEALPSIAAVSRLELITRTRDEAQGWRLKLEGGQLTSVTSAGVPPGTTIDIQDLFFNTPARSKFIKRDSTERSHILKTLQELALSHPAVILQAMFDGKATLALAGAKDLATRLGDLWGTSIVQNLVPLTIDQGPVSVAGLVNTIPAHHPTKAFQIMFVNNRPVQQRMLTHAMYEAYHEWLPVGRHPVFALFITLDPGLLDVNVHPTKREVRFSNERAMYDLLFTKVRELFKPRVDVPKVSWRSDSPLPSSREVEAALSLFQTPTQSQPMAPTTQASIVADAPASPAPAALSNLRILGQFQKVYLLAEQDEELIIIDQHAAAERVLYEKLLARATATPGARQRLLTPFVWELTADQVEIIRDALPALDQLGFTLEPFGAQALALKEWPAAFPELRQAKGFLDSLLESLEMELSQGKEIAHHESVARAACRAAIKANDSLATPEIHHLIKELAACQRPMTCPHGRPTHIRLPLSELHRRFRRT